MPTNNGIKLKSTAVLSQIIHSDDQLSFSLDQIYDECIIKKSNENGIQINILIDSINTAELKQIVIDAIQFVSSQLNLDFDSLHVELTIYKYNKKLYNLGYKESLWSVVVNSFYTFYKFEINKHFFIHEAPLFLDKNILAASLLGTCQFSPYNKYSFRINLPKPLFFLIIGCKDIIIEKKTNYTCLASLIHGFSTYNFDLIKDSFNLIYLEIPKTLSDLFNYLNKNKDKLLGISSRCDNQLILLFNNSNHLDDIVDGATPLFQNQQNLSFIKTSFLSNEGTYLL
jgi:hypothetical protein